MIRNLLLATLDINMATLPLTFVVALFISDTEKFFMLAFESIELFFTLVHNRGGEQFAISLERQQAFGLFKIVLPRQTKAFIISSLIRLPQSFHFLDMSLPSGFNENGLSLTTSTLKVIHLLTDFKKTPLAFLPLLLLLGDHSFLEGLDVDLLTILRLFVLHLSRELGNGLLVHFLFLTVNALLQTTLLLLVAANGFGSLGIQRSLLLAFLAVLLKALKLFLVGFLALLDMLPTAQHAKMFGLALFT
mmetsp:Transcript_28917/g.53127  ORF Transcript_28917/g.53127 Transcript_28917/m.53127 type:complete len:247 (-) Transcript_28917:309-1049(-)